VLIPFHNEELTIASVVRAFRARLPKADIYDNNCSDHTVEWRSQQARFATTSQHW